MEDVILGTSELLLCILNVVANSILGLAYAVLGSLAWRT